MKKILTILISLLVTTLILGQEINRSYDVPPFTGIEAGGVFDITVTKRSILRVQKMRLPINVDNVTSTFRFIMIFLAVLVMKLVAHNPTNRITTATTNFGEYSKISFLMVSK